MRGLLRLSVGALLLIFLVLAAARPSYCIEAADVEYGKAAGERLLLDVYVPDDEKSKHPAIVLVHGGAFSGGDKKSYRGLAQVLTSQGYVVFSVNYRLAPRFPYPAGLDDVQRAVRWVRANASRYTVDRSRIAAVGHSAGGYFAAMLALRDTRDNSIRELASFSSKVTCAADFYGPVDFIASLGSDQGMQVIESYLGRPLKGNEKLWAEASPLSFVSKQCAPLYIFHGAKDPLVPVAQSRALFEALRKVKAKVWYKEIEDAGHGWPPASPAGKKSDSLLFNFLAKQLHP